MTANSSKTKLSNTGEHGFGAYYIIQLGNGSDLFSMLQMTDGFVIAKTQT